MKKKLINLAIIIGLIFNNSIIISFAQNSNENIDKVILDAVAQSNKDLDFSNADIVELSSVATYAADSNTDKAIKVIKRNSDKIENVIIIPSKITEDGNVVNSFTYAVDQGADLNFPLVDLTVYISCYYQHNVVDLTNIYRPTGFTFRWTSGSSIVSVDNIEIKYVSKGKLVNFNSGYEVLPVAYTWSDEKGFSSPVKNQVYYNWDHMMAADRGLTCLSADYGGVVEFQISYLVNNRLTEKKGGSTVFPRAGNQ